MAQILGGFLFGLCFGLMGGIVLAAWLLDETWRQQRRRHGLRVIKSVRR